MDEREKFRQELAKDVLLALINTGGVTLGWTPGIAVKIVDSTEAIVEGFMTKIYDGGKEE